MRPRLSIIRFTKSPTAKQRLQRVSHPAFLMTSHRSSKAALQAPGAGDPHGAGARLGLISKHLSSSSSLNMAAPSSRAGSGSKAAGSQNAEEEALVTSRSNGNLRIILLNRPKALNALNTPMVRMIRAQLRAFTDKTSNASIVALRGEGRALCSGGDVLAVVKAANSPSPNERKSALIFFQEEFELDYMIAKLGQGSSNNAGSSQDKTFISFMDGITMGGGVGLSLHAPFRVATERTMFAMPETGIGYFPDVGVTRCLARLDGKIGQYLGMTGARISGPESYLIGVASHYVPSASIDTVLDRLAQAPQSSTAKLVANVLEEYSSDPFNEANASEAEHKALQETPFLGEKRIALDYAFGQPSAEAVFAALEELSTGSQDTQAARELASSSWGLRTGVSPAVAAWATDTLKSLKTKSPRSLKVTHLAINEARRLDVEEAFRFDMRLATAFCDLSIGRDFYEGVTHTLEKDPATGKRRTGIANWNPKTLAEVDDEKLKAQFFGDVRAAKDAGLSMQVPELSIIPLPDQSREAKRERETLIAGKGPQGWEPAHNQFALPSEAECAALLEGAHPAASSVRLEVDEMVDVLRRHKGEKAGLDFKLRDWAERLARRQQ